MRFLSLGILSDFNRIGKIIIPENVCMYPAETGVHYVIRKIFLLVYGNVAENMEGMPTGGVNLMQMMIQPSLRYGNNPTGNLA